MTGTIHPKVQTRPAKPGNPISDAVAPPQNQIVKRVPAFWIYAILLVLAVYTAVTFVKQENDMKTLHRATAEVQAKIEKEKHLNQQLQEQKMEVTSEDSIEKLAREKLGYVKNGERIFVDTNK